MRLRSSGVGYWTGPYTASVGEDIASAGVRVQVEAEGDVPLLRKARDKLLDRVKRRLRWRRLDPAPAHNHIPWK